MSHDAGAGGDGTNEVRVSAAAAYAPSARIDADEIREAWGRFGAPGVRSKAVAGADEDALTMAAEAGRRALSAADVAPSEIQCLAFGTSTPPLAEEDPTPRLGEFLGLSATATTRNVGGSTRAGTQALAVAADAVETGRFPALVVAADCPRGEPSSPEDHAAGAGAAAFVLTAGQDSAGASSSTGPSLVARAEYAADFPGTRFREAGSERVTGLGVTGYDRQSYLECVTGAVDALSGTTSSAADADADDDTDADTDADSGSSADAGAVDPADASVVALQAPDGKLPYRVTGPLGVDADAVSSVTPVHDLGDLGAASPLVAFARALDESRETVLVVGYGSGAGADALFFDGDAASVATDLELDGGDASSYAEYLRLRGEITGDPPSGGGAAVSVPSWRRTRATRYRLVAGKCPDCGALTAPPEGACRNCHALVDFERVELPRRGSIETATGVSPGGAPPEFAQQGARGGDFPVAIVAFERGGETVSLPMQVTDADPADVRAGDEVEAVIRRVYTQEGVTRYGSKVRPV